MSLEIILCPLFLLIPMPTRPQQNMSHCFHPLSLQPQLPSSRSVDDLPSFGRTENQYDQLSILTSLTQNVLESSLVFSCFVLRSEKNMLFPLYTPTGLAGFLDLLHCYSLQNATLFVIYLLHFPFLPLHHTSLALSILICLPSLRIITLPVQILPQATTLPCLFTAKFLF